MDLIHVISLFLQLFFLLWLGLNLLQNLGPPSYSFNVSAEAQ
jgi:hypothetical protein